MICLPITRDTSLSVETLMFTERTAERSFVAPHLVGCDQQLQCVCYIALPWLISISLSIATMPFAFPNRHMAQITSGFTSNGSAVHLLKQQPRVGSCDRAEARLFKGL